MRSTAQGTHSTVYHICLSELDPQTSRHLLQDPIESTETSDEVANPNPSRASHPGFCVKVVPAEMAVLPPHDVHHEIRLLRSLAHPNIIRLLHHAYDPVKTAWELFFPFHRWTLGDLLDEPRFAPVDYPGENVDDGVEGTEAGARGGDGDGQAGGRKDGIAFLDDLIQTRLTSTSSGIHIALPPPSPLSVQFGLVHPPELSDSRGQDQHRRRHRRRRWRRETFTNLTRSIVVQLTDALAYLHGRGIAHRDIKPGNILVEPVRPRREETGSGSGSGSGSGLDERVLVKLIDLGTALELSVGETSIQYRHASERDDRTRAFEAGDDDDDDDDHEEGGAGEKRGKRLILQVGSGAYRPPELLFGSTTYDPYALDSWALGVTMSVFFTGFVGTPQGGQDGVDRRAVRVGVKRGWRSVSKRDEEDGDSDSDSDDDDLDGRPALPVFSRRRPARNGLVPEPSEQGRYAWEWRRETLFDGSLGEIGLAGSIFRVMGTPGSFEGAGEWESFGSLPDANKISFERRRRVDLVDLLPFLQAVDRHDVDDDDGDGGGGGTCWSEVLNGLIRLEPKERMTMTRLKESLRG